MKNILITGGAGFIGSNLAFFLSKKKYKIFIIDDLSSGNIKNIDKTKFKFFKKNIISINKLKTNIKFDYLIHLAAKAEILISKDNESKYFDANIIGLQETLNFASRNKIKKFIFASSASVYGDTKNVKVKEKSFLEPLHYYAYTKYIGEQMVKKYCNINNLNFIIFRFFNIYGLNSNAVIAKFIAQSLQGKKITIYGNGKQSRDFLHVNDLSNAIFKSLQNNKCNNKIYNLGSGQSKSIFEIKNIISKKKDHIFLPKRADDIEKSISDISKIKKHLKWKPILNLEKSIKEIINKDSKRLFKIKLESIKAQKKSIIEFNIKK